jgi:hypothetical protein
VLSKGFLWVVEPANKVEDNVEAIIGCERDNCRNIVSVLKLSIPV